LKNKKAFIMSFLLDKCCSLLPEGLSTKYYTAKLQTMLQNHYGDTIVIESQKGQGQSNIVFSSSISVADAIRSTNHERKVIREGGMNCNDLWWERSDGEG
jgi:hypothetical protein